MDALLAKANAIQPLGKKRKTHHQQHPSKSKQNPKTLDTTEDHTLRSITKHTSVPKSLLDTHNVPISTKSSYSHIANKKLRTELDRNAAQAARGKALLDDAAEMLLMEEKGGMEVEGDMERTWRIGQSDITESAGQEAARGRREWKLDGGPYMSRYTRNGRHLAIVGRSGHAATFDWQTGTLHSELRLNETCRDITSVPSNPSFSLSFVHPGLQIPARSISLCCCAEEIRVHLRQRRCRTPLSQIPH